MTSKEAIDLIIRNKSVFRYYEDMLKALELAIKALKLIDCPQIIDECKACGGFCIDGKEAADNDSE